MMTLLQIESYDVQGLRPTVMRYSPDRSRICVATNQVKIALSLCLKMLLYNSVVGVGSEGQL
jgi:hypothetical protein